MYLAEAYNHDLLYLREEEYRDYFVSAKYGIIFLDAELRVKNLNRESEILLGITRKQVLGRKAKNAFRQFSDNFLKIFALNEFEDFYTTNVKMDNKGSVLHINALKLRNPTGALSGVIIIMQDVTAIKAAVKQIQTTQMLMSLGELAAGVAHHVRTPLTTISGYLQVMLSRLENETCGLRRDVLEMLLAEVAYINDVVKELILYAKPPINKETGVDVNQILEDALLLTFSKIDGELISIHKELTALPPITADANLLKQCFVNIIQNAVEAMPDGGSISLRTWLNANLNMLVIAIADNGLGIDPQILPRIFEPFYTTKRDRMGLGLSSAQRIIGEHNGFINVIPEKNNGSKVHIYLPLIGERLQYLSSVHQQILNLQ